MGLTDRLDQDKVEYWVDEGEETGYTVLSSQSDNLIVLSAALPCHSLSSPSK